MRFELVQRYRSTTTAVSEAYADADLYPTLVGLPKLGGIEVLSHEVIEGDGVRHRIRYRFLGDLPAAVTAVVDPERLTWVQETLQDVDAGTARFQLLPDHYPDRLRAGGRFFITSDDGAGSSRTVTGEVKVRAPLVGGRVEQAIISGLAEYLEAEAEAVDRWLSS